MSKIENVNGGSKKINKPAKSINLILRKKIPTDMEMSSTEENYIKAIFRLQEDGEENISTNEIARYLDTTAASVTDMLKKLKQKDLVTYERYYGVRLTKPGEQIAKS